MLFAIIEFNPQIDNRIASNDPLGHLVLDTFINALTERLADNTTKDFVDECVSSSAFIRFNTNSALSKLPCPACLLFMTITYVGLTTDSLAIRDFGEFGCNLDPTTLQTIEHQTNMLLTDTRDHQLFRLWIHFNLKCLVCLSKAAQSFRDLCFISSRLWLYGSRYHRKWIVKHHEWSLVLRGQQCITNVEFLYLG